MINEKGQLFGKINVFDFIVILLILLLVFGGGYKLFSINKQIAENTREVTYVLEIKGVREVTADAFVEGEEVFDYDVKGKLGTVLKVSKTEAKRQLSTLDGKVLDAPTDNRVDVYVTVKAEGVIKNTGSLFVDRTNVVDGSECHVTTQKTNCIANFRNVVMN